MNSTNSKNLILLFENFYEIDLLRYDLIALSKKNKVTIYSKNFYLDLEHLKKNQINYIKFENYFSLKSIFSELSDNSVLFFNVYKNEENSFFFDYIKKSKILKISMHHTSQIPYHKKNILLSLINFKKINIKNNLKKILKFFKKKVKGEEKFYDYVVTAGDYPKKNFSHIGKKQIDTISRDFQTYKIIRFFYNFPILFVEMSKKILVPEAPPKLPEAPRS